MFWCFSSFPYVLCLCLCHLNRWYTSFDAVNDWQQKEKKQTFWSRTVKPLTVVAPLRLAFLNFLTREGSRKCFSFPKMWDALVGQSRIQRRNKQKRIWWKRTEYDLNIWAFDNLYNIQPHPCRYNTHKYYITCYSYITYCTTVDGSEIRLTTSWSWVVFYPRGFKAPSKRWKLGILATEVFLHVIALRDPHLEESWSCYIVTWGSWVAGSWWRTFTGLVATQIFFLEFSSRTLGKMNPSWRAYFSDGLVQPPTS